MIWGKTFLNKLLQLFKSIYTILMNVFTQFEGKMKYKVITQDQIDQHNYWISKIDGFDNDFDRESKIIEAEIRHNIQENGIDFLLGNLRLCGSIPERYGTNSSEEKLYSKYTDVVIHCAYSFMGFTSLVIQERADVADVECVTDNFSFVADAKAFRLSRTAKNQKDFKVEAMDSWKHGKSYAMLVCPIYQLPSSQSQIYQQAASRNVCIFSYSHLAVLSRFAEHSGTAKAIELTLEIFKTVEAMNPSKLAQDYWQQINRKMLNFDSSIGNFWTSEKNRFN